MVDMRGTGASSGVKDGCHMIALRADIDGLLMAENNPDLSYRSKTNYAHMCGHDGHTAMLLAAA